MNSNQVKGVYPSLTSSKAALQSQKGQDFQKILDQIRADTDDKKLREACQELEAVFANQLLRQMRATVPKSGLMEESAGSSIYLDMLDEEYSKVIAKSRSNMGIAEMLYKQLKQDIIIQEAHLSKNKESGS